MRTLFRAASVACLIGLPWAGAKPPGGPPRTALAEGKLLRDTPIPIQLTVGAGDSPEVVRLWSVLCHQDGRMFTVRPQGTLMSWPKARWKADFMLLDAKGRLLKSASLVFQNSGIIISRANVTPGELRFTVGPILAPNRARKFHLTIKEVPETTRTTAEWVRASG